MTQLQGKPIMHEGQERVLLTVTEAGKLCGFSRASSYVMANGEWRPFAIRLSERVIRIPYDSLMEWVDEKKQRAAEERGEVA
ncbi:MAG: hypothetical protein IBX61_09490 [Thermoleophilia bacterium]|nr:hypothetical protein [Thermoleophilia bacterium]